MAWVIHWVLLRLRILMLRPRTSAATRGVPLPHAVLPRQERTMPAVEAAANDCPQMARSRIPGAVFGGRGICCLRRWRHHLTLSPCKRRCSAATPRCCVPTALFCLRRRLPHPHIGTATGTHACSVLYWAERDAWAFGWAQGNQRRWCCTEAAAERSRRRLEIFRFLGRQ